MAALNPGGTNRLQRYRRLDKAVDVTTRAPVPARRRDPCDITAGSAPASPRSAATTRRRAAGPAPPTNTYSYLKAHVAGGAVASLPSAVFRGLLAGFGRRASRRLAQPRANPPLPTLRTGRPPPRAHTPRRHRSVNRARRRPVASLPAVPRRPQLHRPDRQPPRPAPISRRPGRQTMPSTWARRSPLRQFGPKSAHALSLLRTWAATPQQPELHDASGHGNRPRRAPMGD